MPLYDAHLHLQDQRLRSDLGEIVGSLDVIGLRGAVINGTRESDWPDVERVAHSWPGFVPAYGLHPWFVAERSPLWRVDLERRLDRRPAAIGEIGLDRWIPGHDLADQSRVFGEQLDVARARSLPFTAHCLKAWGRFMELLRERGPFPSGFLVHSYGGPAELVRPLVDLGAYFSISGYFAHTRKADRRSVFRSIPLERLLVETDAPDMRPPDALNPIPAPRSSDESLNHPANLPAIYAFAADWMDVDRETLEKAVETNFLNLFGAARSKREEKNGEIGDG